MELEIKQKGNVNYIKGTHAAFAYHMDTLMSGIIESNGVTSTMWSLFAAETKQECLDKIEELGITENLDKLIDPESVEPELMEDDKYK